MPALDLNECSLFTPAERVADRSLSEGCDGTRPAREPHRAPRAACALAAQCGSRGTYWHRPAFSTLDTRSDSHQAGTLSKPALVHWWHTCAALSRAFALCAIATMAGTALRSSYAILWGAGAGRRLRAAAASCR